MLLIFAIFIHLMAVMDGNEASMPNLLKDTAHAGAAWLYAIYYLKVNHFRVISLRDKGILKIIESVCLNIQLKMPVPARSKHF